MPNRRQNIFKLFMEFFRRIIISIAAPIITFLTGRTGLFIERDAALQDARDTIDALYKEKDDIQKDKELARAQRDVEIENNTRDASQKIADEQNKLQPGDLEVREEDGKFSISYKGVQFISDHIPMTTKDILEITDFFSEAKEAEIDKEEAFAAALAAVAASGKIKHARDVNDTPIPSMFAFDKDNTGPHMVLGTMRSNGKEMIFAQNIVDTKITFPVSLQEETEQSTKTLLSSIFDGQIPLKNDILPDTKKLLTADKLRKKMQKEIDAFVKQCKKDKNGCERRQEIQDAAGKSRWVNVGKEKTFSVGNVNVRMSTTDTRLRAQAAIELTKDEKGSVQFAIVDASGEKTEASKDGKKLLGDIVQTKEFKDYAAQYLKAKEAGEKCGALSLEKGTRAFIREIDGGYRLEVSKPTPDIHVEITTPGGKIDRATTQEICTINVDEQPTKAELQKIATAIEFLTPNIEQSLYFSATEKEEPAQEDKDKDKKEEHSQDGKKDQENTTEQPQNEQDQEAPSNATNEQEPSKEQGPNNEPVPNQDAKPDKGTEQDKVPEPDKAPEPNEDLVPVEPEAKEAPNPPSEENKNEEQKEYATLTDKETKRIEDQVINFYKDIGEDSNGVHVYDEGESVRITKEVASKQDIAEKKMDATYQHGLLTSSKKAGQQCAKVIQKTIQHDLPERAVDTKTLAKLTTEFLDSYDATTKIDLPNGIHIEYRHDMSEDGKKDELKASIICDVTETQYEEQDLGVFPKDGYKESIDDFLESAYNAHKEALRGAR